MVSQPTIQLFHGLMRGLIHAVTFKVQDTDNNQKVDKTNRFGMASKRNFSSPKIQIPKNAFGRRLYFTILEICSLFSKETTDA